MALTIKNLGIGFLAAGSYASPGTALVAGSTSKSTLIKNISFVNTNTSTARTIGLVVAAGPATLPATGASALYNSQVASVSVPAKSQVIFDTEITLAYTGVGTGLATLLAEKLYGFQDSGADVYFTINGVERDL